MKSDWDTVMDTVCIVNEKKKCGSPAWLSFTEDFPVGIVLDVGFFPPILYFKKISIPYI